jgi:hypothetical protein
MPLSEDFVLSICSAESGDFESDSSALDVSASGRATGQTRSEDLRGKLW